MSQNHPRSIDESFVKDIPSETALKIYFISDPMAKAWHELEAIDAQLGCSLL